MLFNCEEIGTLAFALLFPVIYTKGPSWVSYYTKFVIYYASLTLTSSVILPFSLLRPKDSRNLLWSNRLMKMTSALLGIQWKGPERPLCHGPAVIVINHQSSIDILGLLCELLPLMEGQVTIVAKKSLLYAGPFGLLAYMSGVTFIERSKSVPTLQALTNISSNILYLEP